MNHKETPKLLVKEEVCALLNISMRNLGYMVAQKRFPAGARIGKRCYWNEAAVSRWRAMQCDSQLAWLPADS